MSRVDSVPPIPFRDTEADDEEGRKLALLFRAVNPPEPLSALELAAVRTRLVRRSVPRVRTSRFREAVLLGLALAAGAGVASAGFGLVYWVQGSASETSRPSPPGVAGASVAERSRRNEHLRSPRSGANAPEQAPPTEREPTVLPPVSKSARVEDLGHSAAPEAPRSGQDGSSAGPPKSGLSLESATLARALAQLRRERDPRAALELLDAYAKDFPEGALMLESRIARVDALLALGRRMEALDVLGVLPLERVGRGAELRLVRAELLVDVDSARAVLDFDALLASTPNGDVEERALHGRALCRLRLGDRARAVDDLKAYLARYPNGRFASEVRASLLRLDGR